VTKEEIMGSKEIVRTILLIALGVGSHVASAQPFDGPPSSFTAYWEVPAFNDIPIKGPQAAQGIIFYSHGVSGKHPQYQFPVPEYIRDFARAGWDVIKVQRNNLHENGWSMSGSKHVNDLLERAKKAGDQGYKRIVAAGQSFGGAISIEASIKSDLFHAVIATGPGHGSDACGPNTSVSFHRFADNLQRQLASAIEKMRAPRVVMVMASGDECQGNNDPTDQIRAALNTARAKFIFLDNTMPVRGHGVSGTSQFRPWFSECLRSFVAAEKEPNEKETRCPNPTPVPNFLFPANFKLPSSSGGGLVGMWSGVLNTDRSGATNNRDVCFVIEKVDSQAMTVVMAFGAGPEKKMSMRTFRRTAKKEHDSYVYTQPNDQYHVAIKPKGTDDLHASITSDDGKTTWQVEFKRGCQV
jgi:dienelactone hydrolase